LGAEPVSKERYFVVDCEALQRLKQLFLDSRGKEDREKEMILLEDDAEAETEFIRDRILSTAWSELAESDQVEITRQPTGSEGNSFLTAGSAHLGEVMENIISSLSSAENTLQDARLSDGSIDDATRRKVLDALMLNVSELRLLKTELRNPGKTRFAPPDAAQTNRKV